MPLDYCLWSEIERRMLEADVKGTESKVQYVERLRRTAMTLPKSLVRNAIGKLHGRIQQTFDSKGKHIKMD